MSAQSSQEMSSLRAFQAKDMVFASNNGSALSVFRITATMGPPSGKSCAVGERGAIKRVGTFAGGVAFRAAFAFGVLAECHDGFDYATSAPFTGSFVDLVGRTLA